MRAFLLFVFLFPAGAVDLKPIAPSDGPKPLGPYSPGIDAGDFVYVSGQGARDATGKIPAGIENQLAQCFKNVDGVLRAAGLTPEHVVWSQVFLKDIKHHALFNKLYGGYFGKSPPARSTVAVANLPGQTPVEIAVVAVRDLKQRRPINIGTPRIPVSQAVQVGNRVYLSGILGMDARNVVPRAPRAQVKELMSQLQEVLGKTGLELRHLAYAHVYVDLHMPIKLLGDVLSEILPSETALTVIQAEGLPFGAHIEISGIASKDAKREGGCMSISETIYCPGIAGTIEQVLEKVKESMRIAKSDIRRVAAMNVFLDDIAHYDAVNKSYAAFFGGWRPARATVQPTAKPDELNLAPATDTPSPKRDSPRARITVIGVR